MVFEIIDNANGKVIGKIELTPDDMKVFTPLPDPILSYKEIA